MVSITKERDEITVILERYKKLERQVAILRGITKQIAARLVEMKARVVIDMRNSEIKIQKLSCYLEILQTDLDIGLLGVEYSEKDGVPDLSSVKQVVNKEEESASETGSMLERRLSGRTIVTQPTEIFIE